MIIPHQQLSPETLHALVEEFVSRDGTDYGSTEMSLAQKTRQVIRQLETGSIVIVFDAANETCNIVTREEARMHASQPLPEGAD